MLAELVIVTHVVYTCFDAVVGCRLLELFKGALGLEL